MTQRLNRAFLLDRLDSMEMDLQRQLARIEKLRAAILGDEPRPAARVDVVRSASWAYEPYAATDAWASADARPSAVWADEEGIEPEVSGPDHSRHGGSVA